MQQALLACKAFPDNKDPKEPQGQQEQPGLLELLGLQANRVPQVRAEFQASKVHKAQQDQRGLQGRPGVSV